MWKQKKGLHTRTNATDTTEYIAQTATDKELLEIMTEIVSQGDRNYNDSLSENVLHNSAVYPEEKDNQATDDTYLISEDEKWHHVQKS